MKKEIFALVLLGALFAAGLFNTQYLKDFTGGIGEELALSRAYCENGEYELSLEHARAARELWDARATYAGIATASTRSPERWSLTSRARRVRYTPPWRIMWTASTRWSA